MGTLSLLLTKALSVVELHELQVLRKSKLMSVLRVALATDFFLGEYGSGDFGEYSCCSSTNSPEQLSHVSVSCV